jgi:hypothetical protein
VLSPNHTSSARKLSQTNVIALTDQRNRTDDSALDAEQVATLNSLRGKKHTTSDLYPNLSWSGFNQIPRESDF